MPILFQKMFGGGVLAILFFLGLTFAGFSSLIAMLELPTRVLVDTGIARSRAIAIIVIMIIVAGIPSALSENFLSNQDFVWGVGLMISGALIAWLIIKQGAETVRLEINSVEKDRKIGKWWVWNITWFIPVAAGILLIWWLVQSFVPGQWYNPFASFSFMSCIFQWSIVLVILVAFNRKIANLFA